MTEKTYEELMPVVSALGFPQSGVDNFIANNIEEPIVKIEPVLTKAKAIIVAECFFDGFGKHNGRAMVAAKAGVTPAQLDTIVKEIKAYIAYNAQAETGETEL